MGEIETTDLLVLAGMASKACEHLPFFVKGLRDGGHMVDANQVEGLYHDCAKVLGRLDGEFPGLMPVPHDGETWGDKLKRLKLG